MLDDLRIRLRALLRRKRVEAELEEELRGHIEQQTAKYLQAGMTVAQAKRKASVEFGGMEQTKEECRDARGVSFIETTIRDVRFGLRQLRRSPGFTIVAILTLALGIGANTAIFSAVNRILLHPLPYPHSDRIMAIIRSGQAIPAAPPSEVRAPRAISARHEKRPKTILHAGATKPGRAPLIQRRQGKTVSHSRNQMVVSPGAEGPSQMISAAQPAAHPSGNTHMVLSQGGPVPAGGTAGSSSPNTQVGGSFQGGPPGGKPALPIDAFSYPDYQDLRAQTSAFEELAAYHEARVTLTREGEPTQIPALVASASLFRLLDAKPLLGRLFTPDDDRQGAAPVAMIGERLWRERFSADPGVVGKIIDLNNQAYTVIGVMPASLSFPPFADQAQAWIPLASDPVHQIQQMRMTRGLSYLSLIGKMKPRVTLAQANAQLSTIASRWAMNYPSEKAGGAGIKAAPLAQQLVKNYRLALLVLLAAVGLVLLIACTNVASLLLARATARERELALRLALGAGRRKIVRQMVIESLELAMAGGAAGILVAYVAVEWFTRHLPPMLQEFQGVSVSVSVLLFAAIISIVAGVVIGLLPAWRLSDIRVHETLKGAAGALEAAPAKGRLRAALAVLEVALAVVLLTGAGLLLRSFGNLVSVPLGFDPHGVLMAETNLSAAGYKSEQQWRSFTSTALQRLRGQPGVLEAAAATTPPMSGQIMFLTFSIPGRPLPPGEMPAASIESVSPGYFRLMRIPLLRGRAFADTDTTQSEKVCIVNQAFVRSYFPNVDPLIRQLRIGIGRSGPVPCQIVGVVGNTVSQTLSAAPDPAIYMPLQQKPFPPTFLLRTQAKPAAMASTMRAQLDAIDPALPVAPVTLTSLLSGSLEQGRFQTQLVTLFAALAILLAAVGISGVLGYSVARRTQEIGVRMALGATPGNVVSQVAREGLLLVGVGAVAGLGIAFWLTRWMRSLLFHVSPADPATYIGVALVLLLVALGACALPALRASRVDPAVTLRHE